MTNDTYISYYLPVAKQNQMPPKAKNKYAARDEPIVIVEFQSTEGQGVDDEEEEVLMSSEDVVHPRSFSKSFPGGYRIISTTPKTLGVGLVQLPIVQVEQVKIVQCKVGPSPQVSGSPYNDRERCLKHFGAKAGSGVEKPNGRDKCACGECLQEKRDLLETTFEHLPIQEKRHQIYLQMGAFFCTYCVKEHIDADKPFVEKMANGSVRVHIGYCR